MNRRCCARCRTPYNCGNPSCACHLKAPGTHTSVQAWAAANAEPRPGQRFHLATIRDDEGQSDG